MFRRLSLSLLFIISVCPVPSLASPEEAKGLAKSGIEAYKNGDLQQARNDLESALELGSTSRSLIYNLGVIYFKLGQYEQAKATFQKLIPTRQKALALYNIGLVELALENQSAAKTAFQDVLSSEPKENLQTLATAQLERLEPKPAPSRKSKSWVGLVSASAGYQNNVALFPSSAPESIDSEFIEAIAAGTGYLIGSADSGLKGSLSLYTRQYPSADEFDLQVAKLSSSWVEQTAIGNLSVGLGGSHLRRDQEKRENHARVFSDLTLAACPGKSARCSFALEAMQIEPREEFEAYRGEQYQFEADYRTRLGSWKATARYRFQYNDRADLQTENEYFDLSPQRHGIRGTLSYPLTPSLTMATQAGVRFSRYRKPHLIETSQGTINDTRKDVRGSLSVSGTYQVTRQVNLKLELSHLDNQSNLDRYEYERQSASLTTAFKF